MILIRASLIKILQTFTIGALSVGVLGCFLLSYSYIGGDRQDRAEMVAAAEHALDFFHPTTHGQTQSASLSVDKLEN